jgi:hypothetical protein
MLRPKLFVKEKLYFFKIPERFENSGFFRGKISEGKGPIMAS